MTAPALDAFAADEPALAGPFDLAFIDALKPEYERYLEALTSRLAPGALSSPTTCCGAAASRAPGRSPPTTRTPRPCAPSMAAVLADPRFSATILPVGDGLLIASWLG